MQEKFLTYIKKNNLFSSGSQILLGVSGGVDSMVMANLFVRSGINAAIAHCNFKLRGKESEDDEIFVKEFAAKSNLPYYTQSFETAAHAKIHGISIQMAARELRFNWMTGLCDEIGFEWIAFAHQQDDEAETFFLNLTRGTGIAGLHGILPKSGKIIHPMLFAGRAEILRYAEKYRIPFRQDSSNLKTDYSRNKIRHLVLPELEKINPGFKKILHENISHIRSAESIYRRHLDEIWRRIAERDGPEVRINIEKLMQLPEAHTFLFEFIQPWGFNSSDAKQITEALANQSGKIFNSSTHRIIRDRDYLLIRVISQADSESQNYQIHKNTARLLNPLIMEIRSRERNADFIISSDPYLAHFDAEKLTFPLTLRKWQKGDHFYPLGMKGKKLLSDFFIDQKFSGFQKEDCWILTSNQKVIWVVGHRLDDRFKVTDSSTTVLEIQYYPASEAKHSFNS